MRLPYQLGIQMSNQYEHVHQYDLWTPEQSPDHAESESVTRTLTSHHIWASDWCYTAYLHHWLTVDESTSTSLISYLKWRIGESTSSCHARDATADHDDWWRRCAPPFNGWEQKAWISNFFKSAFDSKRIRWYKISTSFYDSLHTNNIVQHSEHYMSTWSE